MRLWTWILAITLTLPYPVTALAQPADVHEQAEERFKLGIEARNKGDYRGALKRFRVSNDLEPGRGKLLNIALCEEHLGLLASAFKHFQQVYVQLSAGDERVPLVHQHLDAVKPQLPYLKILLAPEAPAGTTVTLDDEPFEPASLGVNVLIDPGKHVVAATAPGAVERHYEILIAKAEQRVVEVTPLSLSTTLILPPDAPSLPLRAKLGFAAIGVGGAALVTGVVAGGVAVAKHQNGCAGVRCTQSELDGYHLAGDVATASLVLGGAIAAAGIVLVSTAPGRRMTSGISLKLAIGLGHSTLTGRF